jgi:NADH-quinone oxidoreductase subunit K
MDHFNFYLIISGVLFTLGVFGVMTRRNAIIMFMCIELMLNAVNLSLVSISKSYGDLNGEVFVFFVIAVAAAEAAVGLAIILAVFRNYYSIEVSDVQDLAG